MGPFLFVGVVLSWVCFYICCRGRIGLVVCLVVTTVTTTLFTFYCCRGGGVSVAGCGVCSRGVGNSIGVTRLSSLRSGPFGTILGGLSVRGPSVVVVANSCVGSGNGEGGRVLRFTTSLLGQTPICCVAKGRRRELSYFRSLVSRLQATNFAILLSSVMATGVGNAGVSVLKLSRGRTDFRSCGTEQGKAFGCQSVGPRFSGLDDYRKFGVILSRCPRGFGTIDRLSCDRCSFSLRLSNRTRNKRFVLPFVNPIFDPNRKLFPGCIHNDFNRGPGLVIDHKLKGTRFPLHLFGRPRVGVVGLGSGGGPR